MFEELINGSKWRAIIDAIHHHTTGVLRLERENAPVVLRSISNQSQHYLNPETSSICITHWKNLEVFGNSFGIHSEHIRIRNSGAISHQVASGQGEKLGNHDNIID